MENSGIFAFSVLLVTGFISYKGMTDPRYFDRYSFQIDGILVHKEYKRLISSGFLHSGWMHFIFNMLAMYSFSGPLESALGIGPLLGLYFGSLIGGNLLALYIHRNHADYTAVGASGAVTGMVFAAIALFPGMQLGLLFLPFHLPSWAFGLLYVLYCIYGIRSQRDNIGHEAHLGGGLIGMAIAIAIFPQVLWLNYVPVLLVAIPSVVFLYFIFTRPDFLLVDNPFGKNRGFSTVEDRYNTQKRSNQKKLDALLDKINNAGIESLSKEEKEDLEKLSK
ncbi:rhomboid family intramembrane serine protease [Fulvivirgaceae bacterium PWU4]|uniref:Rhomboid family intramembrane serine protease n=1 Tax=Chryseosolibacter histidini TaxID=2782349 RepID=A0AAP2GQQ2_9BACT|nr:rhomboid family intramembrane serine protease [Chryseosolibacter histidini]MBT1698767.1 rhomboid family intramembrane serine protease [Chryseosolibacter histidini]